MDEKIKNLLLKGIQIGVSKNRLDKAQVSELMEKDWRLVDLSYIRENRYLIAFDGTCFDYQHGRIMKRYKDNKIYGLQSRGNCNKSVRVVTLLCDCFHDFDGELKALFYHTVKIGQYGTNISKKEADDLLKKDWLPISKDSIVRNRYFLSSDGICWDAKSCRSLTLNMRYKTYTLMTNKGKFRSFSLENLIKEFFPCVHTKRVQDEYDAMIQELRETTGAEWHPIKDLENFLISDDCRVFNITTKRFFALYYTKFDGFPSLALNRASMHKSYAKKLPRIMIPIWGEIKTFELIANSEHVRQETRDKANKLLSELREFYSHKTHHLEDYPNYIINDAGDMFSLVTFRLLAKMYQGKDWNWRGFFHINHPATGKGIFLPIDWLVCKAFIDPTLDKTHPIGHKDGNMKNNNLDNLMPLPSNYKPLTGKYMNGLFSNDNKELIGRRAFSHGRGLRKDANKQYSTTRGLVPTNLFERKKR